METLVKVTFHQIDHSNAVEMVIRKKAEQLKKVLPRLTSISVLLEPAFYRHRHGNQYKVKIQILVPGGEVVVDRAGKGDESHENIYAAIRDAFAAAKRRLEDYANVHFSKGRLPGRKKVSENGAVEFSQPESLFR